MQSRYFQVVISCRNHYNNFLISFVLYMGRINKKKKKKKKKKREEDSSRVERRGGSSEEQ